MNESNLSADLTVAEVLNRWNGAATAFVRLRMACVGCPLASFETLEAAAGSYGLAPDLLLAEIAACILEERRIEEPGAQE